MVCTRPTVSPGPSPQAPGPIMKFLCVECDQQMAFAERQLPGDGTLAATFKCPKCGRVVAMLTNPMETQLVSSLGVEIGGRTVPAEPFEMVRANVVTGGPAWSTDAQERLEIGRASCRERMMSEVISVTFRRDG